MTVTPNDLPIAPELCAKLLNRMPILMFTEKSGMTCNRAARRLLGDNTAPTPTAEFSCAVKHPSGQLQHCKAQLPWIRALRERRTLSGIVCRFVMPNGAMRWFDVTAVPQLPKRAGKPKLVVCRLHEITSSVKHVRHLQEELQLEKTIIHCYARSICAANSCPECGVLQTVLAQTAKRLGAMTRLYVFENHHALDNGLGAQCVCGTTARSALKLRRTDIRFAWNTVPAEWQARLSNGQAIILHNTLPDKAAFFGRLGLVRPVLMPLFRSGRWLGFVAAGDLPDERPIRKEFLRLTHKAAELICAMLEHRQAQNRMLQARKMETLGTLSAGIAHDFNNILANIRATLQVAQLDCADNRSAADTYREINHEINEAAELVRQLMLFGSSAPAPRRWMPVNERIKAMARLIRRVLPGNVALEINLASDELVAALPAGHFTRILMNLILNARDAMPRGGTLKIGATWTHGSDIVAPSMRIPRNKYYVCIKVSDTGTGIPAAILKRMFDPFYTTKRPDRGTGLGLSIVQALVHRHHGCITVESQPSKGATFRCYLPGRQKTTSAGARKNFLKRRRKHAGQSNTG